MKLMAEILLAVKDSKLPSLEKIAYLIRTRVDDRSQSDMNVSRFVNTLSQSPERRIQH